MDNQDYRRMLINRSYKFSLEIIRLIDNFPKGDFFAQTILHQLARSATSIGANIIEAQGSCSRKDFINFIHYSLKSANETKYWLKLISDSRKINREKISSLLKEVLELTKILGSTIVTLKNKK